METTYEYIKGQGWVGFVDRRIKAKTYDGIEVWLIDRKPLVGEYYKAKLTAYSQYVESDGSANLESFKSLIAEYYFEDFRKRDSPTYSDSHVFVTIEKVQ